MTAKGGMGSHERTREGATNTWLTPKHVLDALGPFDLDPCAAPEPRPWNTASVHFTLPYDGLQGAWFGRVWLNPPYGPHAAGWLEKLAEHGNGIALLFARTETRSFFANVWAKADALLFLEGRLRFCLPDGTVGPTSNAGAPSVLVAYGDANADLLATRPLPGAPVDLRVQRHITRVAEMAPGRHVCRHAVTKRTGGGVWCAQCESYVTLHDDLAAT